MAKSLCLVVLTATIVVITEAHPFMGHPFMFPRPIMPFGPHPLMPLHPIMPMHPIMPFIRPFPVPFYPKRQSGYRPRPATRSTKNVVMFNDRNTDSFDRSFDNVNVGFDRFDRFDSFDNGLAGGLGGLGGGFVGGDYFDNGMGFDDGLGNSRSGRYNINDADTVVIGGNGQGLNGLL